MKSLAIVGAQWGDEGKGKLSDLLGQQADLVVRFQGGNNAGHTIIVGDMKIVLHLIPSGILNDKCTSVIGHGVVLDPVAFKTEVDTVNAANIKIDPSKLKISSNCSIITTYNKLLDGQRESKGPVKIGTTGKGIGPAYEDKVSRKGLKLKDLFDLEILTKKLTENFQEKEVLFTHLYKVEYPSIEEEAQKLFELGKLLKPYACDTFSFIDESIKADKKLIFEGAQGVLLDIDYGTYPYVTSSSTASMGLYSGAGLPGHKIGEVLGITKAYLTRVGEGPFPTEQLNDIGEQIQKEGHEFGATTGRRRRCGWLDLPLLKYSIKASNITSLALTKLDVLTKVDILRVCTGYKYKGEIIDCAYPGINLDQVEPIYKEFQPFKDTFEMGGKIESNELQDYLKFIEEHTDTPISILTYGPERSQIKFRQEIF